MHVLEMSTAQVANVKQCFSFTAGGSTVQTLSESQMLLLFVKSHTFFKFLFLSQITPHSSLMRFTLQTWPARVNLRSSDAWRALQHVVVFGSSGGLCVISYRAFLYYRHVSDTLASVFYRFVYNVLHVYDETLPNPAWSRIRLSYHTTAHGKTWHLLNVNDVIVV